MSEYTLYGCWFEDLDPNKRVIEEADGLHDATMWARSQGATVVGSDDDGVTWRPLRERNPDDE